MRKKTKKTEKQKKKLCVYTSSLCFICHETRQMVKRIKMRFTELEIEIIELENTDEEIPEDVFSVPTYRFENRTISLGNPDPEDFFSRLEKLLSKN